VIISKLIYSVAVAHHFPTCHEQSDRRVNYRRSRGTHGSEKVEFIRRFYACIYWSLALELGFSRPEYSARSTT
jgi:hypothetical protein